MRTRILQLALVLAMLPLVSGCFYSREIARTERAIERANPGVDFDRTFMLSMGRGSIGTLAELSSFVRQREALMASDYLREIKRVKVGVYEIEGPIDRPLSLGQLPQSRSGSWSTLARVNDGDSVNFSVMYRERFGEVRDLFVVALDAPDLLIVRVTGNFTEMLIRALEDFSEYMPRTGLFDKERARDEDPAP